MRYGPSIAAAVMALMVGMATWSAELTPLPIHAPGDAGPVLSAAPSVSAWLPVGACLQSCSLGIQAVGGGIRGVGVLADFSDGSPQFIIARSSSILVSEPYLPANPIRLMDPDGNTVRALDLAEDPNGRLNWIAKSARGPWRLSVGGGRQGDTFTIAWPATPWWGIRGEPALGLRSEMPNKLWLWVPPETNRILIEQIGGAAGLITAAIDGVGTSVATSRREGYGQRLVAILDEPPANGLLCIDCSRAVGCAMLVAGAPGLLCPTPEAARHLRGGMVERQGRWFSDSFYARLQDWIGSLRSETVTIFDPSPLNGSDGSDPRADVSLFGEYGLFTGVRTVLARPLNAPIPAGRPMTAWGMPFTGMGLATLYQMPVPGNSLRGDRRVLMRAALEVFRYALAQVDATDLIWENDLLTGAECYPAIHAFFLYGGLIGGPLALVHDQLDPQVFVLWRELAQRVGDRLADFQGFESNQWLHNLHGHLALYRATGERRFLGYWRRGIRAFIGGAFGAASKFGQHPAGYFLEEFGCDGNYDNMNLTALAAQWLEYRRLDGADPVLAAEMFEACERNLRFKRLLWAVDRQGQEVGTNAHCSRVGGTLIAANPFGDYLLRPFSAVARARCESMLDERSSLALASVMPYRAWNGTIAAALQRNCLAARSWEVDHWNGALLPYLNLLPDLPAEASVPVDILPFKAVSGRWELPGIVAWKSCGLYAVVFHDVVNADPHRRPRCVMGGGPTMLWADGSGPLVLSMRPSGPQATAASVDDVVFSAVCGLDGQNKLVHSGREASTLHWIVPGQEFEIEESIAGEGGAVRWIYRQQGNHLLLRIDLRSEAWHDTWVNLPLAPGWNASVLTDGTGVADACTSISAKNGHVVVIHPPKVGGQRTMKIPIVKGLPVEVEVITRPQ